MPDFTQRVAKKPIEPVVNVVMRDGKEQKEVHVGNVAMPVGMYNFLERVRKIDPALMERYDRLPERKFTPNSSLPWLQTGGTWSDVSAGNKSVQEALWKIWEHAQDPNKHADFDVERIAKKLAAGKGISAEEMKSELEQFMAAAREVSHETIERSGRAR